MKIELSARVVALLAATGVVVGVACSSTNTNPAPDGGGGSSIVTSSVATSGSSGTGGASTSSSSGGTGGATTTTSGGATCYDGGSPMTTDQFLNPCEPSATCQTFPNSTLPGLTADGGLPPLP